MTGADGHGVTVTMAADDLLGGLDLSDEPCDVHAETFAKLPSAHLTLDAVIALRARIDVLLANGSTGVVVVQGTDTIEETSFALELLAGHQGPVVVTGAMRTPQAPGSDGPANLVAAIRTAADRRFADLGTLVVLNDEIHAARFVRKSHTGKPSAFVSEPGPLGWVSEGRPRLMLRTSPALTLSSPVTDLSGRHTVPLVTCALDDGPAVIEAAAAAGADGLVVEGLGGGHAPGPVAIALKRLAGHLPVVLASRTSRGEVLRSTYGFAGSERDLLAAGLINSYWLGGPKARMLLLLLLRAGVSDPTAVAMEFRRLLDH